MGDVVAASKQSNFVGTLIAGPQIPRCLPQGKATIFMKGIHRHNLSSSGFNPLNSMGTTGNNGLLAFAWTGMFPLKTCHKSEVCCQHLHTGIDLQRHYLKYHC